MAILVFIILDMKHHEFFLFNSDLPSHLNFRAWQWNGVERWCLLNHGHLCISAVEAQEPEPDGAMDAMPLQQVLGHAKFFGIWSYRVPS